MARKSAKVGAAIKAHAKRRRSLRTPTNTPKVKTHRGRLSKADAERIALDGARPLTAYIGMQDGRWRVYHLNGLVKDWIGPAFPEFRDAKRLSDALNRAGVERYLTADGTPIGDWRQASGKRWKPTAKERRAARKAAVEEGRDPVIAEWLLAPAA